MLNRYSGANETMRHALGRVAPGTPLRDGIDRIVRAKAGALLVLADDPEVLAICSGGFLLDAEFSPQRLSELAKMDGAIILASDASRIARANVHLVPNPNVPTSETGTRHRTAERVARSIGVPVISVSEDMAVVTVYTKNERYQLEPQLFVLAEGATSDGAYAHEGEEFLYLLSGAVTVWVGDGETYALDRAGDALTFPSTLPHRWRNDARGESRLLWINTPPTF